MLPAATKIKAENRVKVFLDYYWYDIRPAILNQLQSGCLYVTHVSFHCLFGIDVSSGSQ